MAKILQFTEAFIPPSWIRTDSKPEISDIGIIFSAEEATF